jgi:hypothetical protein
LSDLVTEAVREAYASRTGDVILNTIELRHPAFLEEGQPVALRFVADGADQTLLLEADAPMDPGASVVFTAMPFGFTPPSDEEDAVPQVKIWIDNVSSEVAKHLEEAVKVRHPIEMTWREYVEGHASPQQRLDGIDLSNVKVTATRATATARLNDWPDRLFPAKVYDRETYRTLAQ